MKDRYWHSRGDRNWVFGVKREGKITFELIEHAKIEIVRHTKVQSGKSLFDGDTTYWTTRMGKHPEMTKTKATLQRASYWKM